METILARVTQQAMNYAIRSGIAITSGYAIQQCSRLVRTTAKNEDRDELVRLQSRLDSKIHIIAPAIDMIELIAARGNTTLESAVSLTKDLRWEIQTLGESVSKAAAEEERSRGNSSAAKSSRHADVRMVILEIKLLLDRIEDSVPLINLAITTSGVSLSTKLPPSVSPSRLLQASTFLTAGDARYGAESFQPAQVGPTFTVSMYMLFLGHANRAQDEDSLRRTVWKEVIHKAQLKIMRVPLDQLGKVTMPRGLTHVNCSVDSLGSEFAYQLAVVEDLDDDRVHTFEKGDPRPERVDDIVQAGIRTAVPVYEISKIFYADTGKVLNIGRDAETNNPVLLLKRDPNAFPPRRLVVASELAWTHSGSSPSLHFRDVSMASNDEQFELDVPTQREPSCGPKNQPKGQVKDPWSLPAGLDPEWMAFEMYEENYDSDSDYEYADGASSSVLPSSSRYGSVDSSFTTALSRPDLQRSAFPSSSLEFPMNGHMKQSQRSQHVPFALAPPVATSLSLLEMLIRLTSLQQFQQCSHLAISDELLNFFLDESSTTGAAPGDAEARKRIRTETRQHVGFDPYDESPVKRRGETYQNQPQGNYENRDWGSGHDYARSPTELHSDQSYQQSPLLLYSREHSSRSRSGTPVLTSIERDDPSTPASTLTLPGRENVSSGSLATPPGSTRSREHFLKAEAARARGPGGSRNSPLAREASTSVNDKGEQDAEPVACITIDVEQ